jgi:hypothetical protein
LIGRLSTTYQSNVDYPSGAYIHVRKEPSKPTDDLGPESSEDAARYMVLASSGLVAAVDFAQCEGPYGSDCAAKPSRTVVYVASERKAERSFLDALRVPVENTTPRSNAPTEVQPETGFRFRPREVIELQVLDTQIDMYRNNNAQTNQPTYVSLSWRSGDPSKSRGRPTRASESDIVTAYTFQKQIETIESVDNSFRHLFSRDRGHRRSGSRIMFLCNACPCPGAFSRSIGYYGSLTGGS